jgi:hypothetical protein
MSFRVGLRDRLLVELIDEGFSDWDILSFSIRFGFLSW